VLSADAKAALVARLASQPSGATWIVYDGRDAGAERLAKELAAAFGEAHWSVKNVGPVKFPVRAGIAVMVADVASATTQAIDEALARARLEHWWQLSPYGEGIPAVELAGHGSRPDRSSDRVGRRR
jgi:hypothetical protein